MEEQRTTLRELSTPTVNQQPLYIEFSNIDVAIELKYDVIHLLLVFSDLASEDPISTKKFLVVCSTMNPQRVIEEQIKLRAFPLSLTDKANDLFYYFPY